jgi:hypothetical protein
MGDRIAGASVSGCGPRAACVRARLNQEQRQHRNCDGFGCDRQHDHEPVAVLHEAEQNGVLADQQRGEPARRDPDAGQCGELVEPFSEVSEPP